MSTKRFKKMPILAHATLAKIENCQKTTHFGAFSQFRGGPSFWIFPENPKGVLVVGGGSNLGRVVMYGDIRCPM